MCADMIAVHEEVGDVLHAVELHEQPFRCPFGGYVHVVLIIGCRFEEITAGSRVGIPCVGQGYVPGVVAAVLRLEEETPSFVERKYLAGLHRSAGGKEQECCYVSFHGSRIYYASACKDNTTSVQNQIFEMHAAGCRRARSRCRTGADSRITAVCGPPRRIAGRISKRRLAGQTARPAAESVPAAAVCRRDGRILRRFRIKKAADRASSVCRKQECYLKWELLLTKKTLGCAVPALGI